MDIRKTLAGASVALVAFTQIATGIATAATFSDVDSSNWAYSYVEQLVEDGVVDSADNFRPNDNLNRAELVKIALKAAGIEIDTEDAPSFSDVAANAWYYPYVATAAKLGIVGGYTNANGTATGQFGPADLVNRAAATKILINAYGIAFDLTPASTFSDVQDATAWFYPYVVTAYNQSIVDGYANGKFGPNDAVTRAQIAKITVNAANPTERVATGEEEEVTTPVEMGDGELSIEISDKTPVAATLPKKAQGVPAAAFDFTASKADDVRITALTIFRSGLGNDDTVSSVALFDKDGNRISKAKTFSTSEDSAVVSILGGGITVKAGKTITLYARVNVGNTASQQFALAIKNVAAVTSNAADVSGDFPVVGETMDVGGVAAAELFIQSDGVPSSVKLGQTDTEISKFKIKNNDNNADITIYGITLKEEGSVSEDTDLANYKLYIDGKVVATAETSNDKYVSLTFDTPLVVKSAKTLKASLHADIIGGASKYINFQVDNSLDVLAIDGQYGYGPDVDADGTNPANTSDFNSANDGSTTAKRVAVDAGELAIVAMDAANTDIRQNKKDVVLGTLKITVNAGQDLELQKLKVAIQNIDGTTCAIAPNNTNLEDIIENVEIYTGSSVYDLGTEAGITGCTGTYEDSDLSIILNDGKTYEFQVRADTRNVDQDGNDIDMSKVKLEVSIDGIGAVTKAASGLYVVETEDDQVVTDITPSSVTFKSLTGRESTTSINTIVQSPTKNAVIGTKGVEVLEFETKAGNASDLYVTSLKVKGTVNDVADDSALHDGTDTLVSNSRVNKATLYFVDGSTKTELDTVSGSQFASGIATFDGFREKIATNATARFLVTVDIINDINQDNDTLNFELTSITMEDDDADDVTTGTVNGAAKTLSAIDNAVSARTVTISGTGSLTATVDNTDSETDSAKWVLGNTTYKYVASYELTAENEGVKIKDLTLDETNAGPTVLLKNAIAELILYDEAGTEIARKSVTSDSVDFTDINYVIEEGSENVYVGVKAQKLGKDQAGSIIDGMVLKLTVTDAEGAESGKTVTNPAQTGASLAFGVIPTHISNVEYVTSYSGTSVNSELTTGETVIGILKITTEASSNTDATDNSSLTTDLTTFTFDVATDAAPASFTVERLGGSGSDKIFAAAAGGAYAAGTLSTETVTVNLATAGTNYQIDNATSAYFAIKASGMDLTASRSAQVKLDLSSQIAYSSDDADGLEVVAGVVPRADLRLDTTTLNLPQVTYKL